MAPASPQFSFFSMAGQKYAKTLIAEKPLQFNAASKSALSRGADKTTLRGDCSRRSASDRDILLDKRNKMVYDKIEEL